MKRERARVTVTSGNSHQIDGYPLTRRSRVNPQPFLSKLGERAAGTLMNNFHLSSCSKWVSIHPVKFTRRTTAVAKSLAQNLVLEYKNGTIVCAS
jgi:hypothetical protein